MKKYLRPKYLLIAILAVAFLIRWWGMNTTDMLGDEAAYAFRSVGYVDYLGTSFQTQPIDWYKDSPELPAWTALSFHDAPPLFFAIQHAFFAIFGDSMRVARLPAILAGTFATWLIYEIVKKILAIKKGADSGRLQWLNQIEVVALLAAGIFAIEPATVAIFRTSLIEPVLIFFILLNLFYFLKFLEDRSSWLMFGLTLGAVALTKYNGVFLLPVYFVYLLIYDFDLLNYDSVSSPADGGSRPVLNLDSRRHGNDNVKILKDWRLYASLLTAVLLFSPVIAYNWQMYKSVGHFDLQFAYLLKQATPEWTGLLGKEQAPFSDILKNLNIAYGLPMLFTALLGLGFSMIWHRKYGLKGLSLMGLYLVFIFLLFIKIGSAQRFLQMLSPAMAFFGAVGLWGVWNMFSLSYLKFTALATVIVFFIFEIFTSVNTNILKFPSYGIAGLDNYLTEELGGIESGVIPEADNRHLNELTKDFAAKKTDKPRALVMIVYNDNVALPTLEWIFYRRFFYHSIPTLFVENFQKVLLSSGPESFKDFTIYFVQSTENTILNPFKIEKTVGAEFEKRLQDKGLGVAKSIIGTDNKEMFRVYKWSM